MTNETPPAEITRAELERAFERKVQRSRWALIFERLWPRLWLVAAVVALFVLVSLTGVWAELGDIAHWALLALFGTALAATLIHAIRTPTPTREEAVRRIERVSGVPPPARVLLRRHAVLHQ